MDSAATVAGPEVPGAGGAAHAGRPAARRRISELKTWIEPRGARVETMQCPLERSRARHHALARHLGKACTDSRVDPAPAAIAMRRHMLMHARCASIPDANVHPMAM